MAVLKHDAHDFEEDKPGKDTWRMTKAGADTVIISGEGHSAILENRPVPPEELLKHAAHVDVIITEGYKHGPWKKIGVARKATGKGLPPIEGEYFATAADYLPEGAAERHFDLDDAEGVAELIIKDAGIE